MGNLNPGGSRSKGARLFTAGAIRKAVQHAKPDHAGKAATSIAGTEHGNNREAERRRRQLERQEAKRK